MIVDNVTQLIGKTPLLRMDRFGAGLDGNILGKLEFFNPGSSVKDRIALWMIEQAEKEGLLKESSTIIEPTSGNTGIGLAWVAAVKGYKVIITMPESMSIERRKILIGLGAELVLTPAEDGMQGSINEANILADKIPGSFIPQQFMNKANPLAHYESTGPELWDDLNGKIDIFIAGVGTGGTISGVGKYLKEKNPKVKIVAVEPFESAVLSGEDAGPHMIQGIGAGFIPVNYDPEVVDEVLKIETHAAFAAAREIAKKEGVLVGISSGANAAAAKIYAEKKENAGKNIVTIMCDTGERYISTILFHQD